MKLFKRIVACATVTTILTSAWAVNGYCAEATVYDLVAAEGVNYSAAAAALSKGKYAVPVSLMNASNIANPSMAASCIVGGSLDVAEDGAAKVTVDLTSVTFAGLTLYAQDWKIYQGNAVGGNTVAAEYVQDENGHVVQISFTLPDNSMDGVYVNMTVPGLMSPDAYIKIDFAKAAKATEFGSAKTPLLPGTYSLPVAMKNATNINNNSMAAGCINGKGELMVCKDGTAMVTVNLQPASAYGLTLSASDWKVYQGGDTSSELIAAAWHNSAGATNQIKYTLPDNSFDGTYVNMYIGAPMNTTQNAYFLLDYKACEKISAATADTSNPVYADGKAEITVSVPVPEDGKWIHKVGITVDGNDSELIKYKDGNGTRDFVADITAASYGGDTVGYESYYIYNYSDGDFSADINKGNYKNASEDDGSAGDPLQLFKMTLSNGTTTFKEAE